MMMTALIFQAIESLLYLALWLAVPIETLSELTGFKFETMVYTTAIFITIYVALGGMNAIMSLDMIHLGVIFLGNMIVVAKGTSVIGGIHKVFAANMRHGRRFFVMDLDPFTRSNTSWLILLGYSSFGILNYGFNQSIIDKYSSVEVPKAQKILWLQIPLMLFSYIIAVFLGMNMAAFYEGCDVVLTKRAMTPEDILSTYVKDIVGHIPGVLGLFSASLLSGTLSVTASNLISLTRIVNEHFVRRSERLNKFLKDRWYLMGSLTTIIATILLPLVVLLVFLDRNAHGLITSPITVLIIVKSPLLGVYLLGFFNKRSNREGALIGLAMAILIGIGLLVMNIMSPVHSDTAPEGATIRDCPEVYCLVTLGTNETKCYDHDFAKNMSDAVEKKINRYYSTTEEEHDEDKDIPTTFNYSLGGIVTILVSFLVGSLTSLCFKQNAEEKKLAYDYLTDFMHEKNDEDKRNLWSKIKRFKIFKM